MSARKAGWRKERKVGSRSCNTGSIWIYTEGEKTEPIYFKELVHRICLDAQNRNGYHVISCGRGGTGLFYEVKAKVAREGIAEGDIYIVFDKDDTENSVFDKLIHDIEALSNDKLKWHAIWSNECFELWYLLHFEYMNNDIGRARYFEKLDTIFRKHGLSGYQKNMEKVYSTMNGIGDMSVALANAEKLEKANEGKHPSLSIPGTSIRSLMLRLIPYLPESDRKILGLS